MRGKRVADSERVAPQMNQRRRDRVSARVNAYQSLASPQLAAYVFPGFPWWMCCSVERPGQSMREWFLQRQDKRVTVETLLPGEKGGSYTGVVAWVGGDALVLQLANLSRLIPFHAIESATDAQSF